MRWRTSHPPAPTPLSDPASDHTTIVPSSELVATSSGSAAAALPRGPASAAAPPERPAAVAAERAALDELARVGERSDLPFRVALYKLVFQCYAAAEAWASKNCRCSDASSRECVVTR